jgi:aldehyde:ferredoxin oxidoreductase
MPYGYNGKILHVHLSTAETWIDEHDVTWYRTYLGGRNIALYYLLKELPVDVGPLDPENILVFTPSVITGAPVPGTSRFTVAAKSPLTNAFGEAQAGGWWGPELKFAGYDALVIHGRSEVPVYLWIHDGEVEIRNAAKLWGQTTGATTQWIRAEHADKLIRVVSIGPAGENLVRFACVVDQARHTAGRCGLGAVMGSKNLKAIACRGRLRTKLADAEYIKSFAKSFSARVSKNADTSQLHEFGTSNYYANANAGGALPTRNWNSAVFEGADNCNHLAIRANFEVEHDRCFACTVRCKQVLKAEKPYSVDPVYGGPEFETMTSFSAICGSDNVFAMCKAHELCNAYGLDTISTGATIAWAMECFKEGLLTTAEADGFTTKFGDHEGMLKLIEMIAFRQGFGDLLANGSASAAQSIGRGTTAFSMSVKGQEFAMHEPRSKMGLAYHFALSPTGADHIQAEHDGAFDPNLTGYTHKADAPSFFMEQTYPLGMLNPVPSLSASEDKARMFFILQHHFSFMDVLDICVFTTAPVRITTFDEITKIVQAVTGWNISFWEIMKAGERGVTMARCFNLKHGLTTRDDYLPERMYQPAKGGPQEGSFIPKEVFADGVRLYYEMNGWDRQTSVPTPGKLIELGLDWLREDMRKRQNELQCQQEKA